MTKRRCPKCHRSAYSAAEHETTWICPHCGSPIAKMYEERMGECDGSDTRETNTA